SGWLRALPPQPTKDCTYSAVTPASRQSAFLEGSEKEFGWRYGSILPDSLSAISISSVSSSWVNLPPSSFQMLGVPTMVLTTLSNQPSGSAPIANSFLLLLVNCFIISTNSLPSASFRFGSSMPRSAITSPREVITMPAGGRGWAMPQIRPFRVGIFQVGVGMLASPG